MVPKFRGWDRKNHVMYDFMMMCFYVNLKNVLYRNNLTDFDVDMFTGLKDANGKEIYEGDIVKSSYKYAQPKISQVIMEDGNSYILGEDLATGNEMLVSDHINEIEVIGNMYENLELLEAQHE
ncbi:YopX family protein [Levilactobacillus brevis]|uniref:YopX family protein n=2 Tax=Levilactobacillus brevis TaxID=1580 RepID=UPI001CFB7408|nr:YopX family protein [Levilactobacillus brevis]